VVTRKRKAETPEKSEADSPLDEIAGGSHAVEQLARGRVDLVGFYLRDPAGHLREINPEVLDKLISIVGDPENERRLTSGRRKKGRPKDPRIARRNAEIVRDIEANLSHCGKVEAAVEAAAKKWRLSRSRVYAIWSKREISASRTQKASRR
jgi:hypothetical protein